MKRILVLFLVIIMAAGVLSACRTGDTPDPTPTATPETTRMPSEYAGERVATTAGIVGLKGPTSMGMVQLYEKAEPLSDLVSVEYSLMTAPDKVTAGLLNGEINIAAVPTNLASVLYNKTEGNIRLLAINTFGVIHIVADKSLGITSLADLKGKKVIASGKGASPESVLNYLLDKNGLTPGTDIDVEYRTDHSEVATLMITGEADIALLPQPFVTTVTMKNQDLELAVDLTVEWQKVAPAGSELAMGCLIATADFAETYPDEINKLLAAYTESVKWVNENHSEAAALIVKHGILPEENLAKTAIPGCNIRYVGPQESKDILNTYFEILKGFEPKSIGGKLPDDDFYFKP
ncbi:MAG: ABC transporter substrate-binding protein [Clostridia bacterium]|nr:ABC transporter substrate-binding protein [Clostridia bacterium]